MSDDVDIDDEVDHNLIDPELDPDGEVDDDLDDGLDDEPTIAEDVLRYLVRSVVEEPDAVNVEVDDRGKRISLTVTVGDGDMGRVIGRRGRIANAIRTIVRAAATRDDVEVEVEFED